MKPLRCSTDRGANNKIKRGSSWKVTISARESFEQYNYGNRHDEESRGGLHVVSPLRHDKLEGASQRVPHTISSSNTGSWDLGIPH